MYRIFAFIARNWPFRHGTGVLVERPAKLVKTWPHNKLIRLKDGRIFQGDLNDTLYRSLYLYGSYEPLVSASLIKLVHPGDVVVDVGANIGIITALLGKLVGQEGRVYSFEPVPPTYEKLIQTIKLNHLEHIVQAQSIAIGDGKLTRATIFAPVDHSCACASSRLDKDTKAIPYLCNIISLDQLSFLPKIPSLIKVDVEGGEMSVLQGAEHICDSEKPPIWILEINFQTSRRFNYEPEILALWLADRKYTQFYWSDDHNISIYRPGDSFISSGTLYALPYWVVNDYRFLI